MDIRSPSSHSEILPALTRRCALISLILLISLASPCTLLGQTLEGVVRSIEVTGNKRVDPSTIQYYIKTKVGQPLAPKTIRKDIERIYNLGQFSDIRVDTRPAPNGDGLIVTFIVEEIPSVGDVKFSGNANIKTEDLRPLISLKRGNTFREHLIQDSLLKITDYYKEKAYFLVDVKINTKTSPDGLVDVLIQIHEGEKVKVEEIRFIGNKTLDADDISNAMETEEKTWLSWFDDSGVYKRDVLKLDQLRIESYYQDHGFIKARVKEPKIEINKEDEEIYITINIEEGQQYRLGKITINGDDTYSPETLLEKIKSKTGEIYNASQVRGDSIAISELYSEKGFAYSDVNPVTTVNEKTKTIDVEMKINPGRKVFVGNIEVVGNVRTRDNVIRREYRLHEGDLFDSRKLKRTKQRLNNLQFFDSVKIDTKRGDSPELIDLTTTVTERPTGSFTFGAGFSSVEKVIFNASVSQNNLFGKGQQLNLSTTLSARRTNFNLRFTDPRIFDSDISMGVDLFNTQSNFFSFDSETTGAGLRFGKNLSETDWVGIGYRYSVTEVSDVLPQNETPFLFNGTTTTSRIGPSWIRDTRDNFLNPTQGQRHVVRFEIAGNVLGGADFFKTAYEGTWYHKLIGKLVVAFHGELELANGYGGEELPSFERYFLGGANSLRGFTIRQVGPKDVNGDPLGGDQSLLFNAELQYPITKEFRVFTFYDRGNVYGDGPDLRTTSKNFDIINMRESVGGGIRFLSPFGPIGLAYGIKLDPVPGDSNAEFHFSAGNAF